MRDWIRRRIVLTWNSVKAYRRSTDHEPLSITFLIFGIIGLVLLCVMILTGARAYYVVLTGLLALIGLLPAVSGWMPVFSRVNPAGTVRLWVIPLPGKRLFLSEFRRVGGSGGDGFVFVRQELGHYPSGTTLVGSAKNPKVLTYYKSLAHSLGTELRVGRLRSFSVKIP